MQIDEIIKFISAPELTISSDAITVTQANHKLQPESGTADNLSTINGTSEGQFGVLYVSDFGTDTITIKHNVGNILCVGAADISLSHGCVFWYSDGTKVFCSGGGGGGGTWGSITGTLSSQTDLQTALNNAKVFVKGVYSKDGAVATGTTQIPVDDTIPQNTEGTQFLSVSITPANALNILDIYVSVMISASAIVHMTAALFQDSVANALAAKAQKALAAGDLMQIELHHSMVAGTTSAITFKVRVGGNGASTITINGAAGARLFGGVSASIIRVTERTP
jgi:hypothetical protein